MSNQYVPRLVGNIPTVITVGKRVLRQQEVGSVLLLEQALEHAAIRRHYQQHCPIAVANLQEKNG